MIYLQDPIDAEFIRKVNRFLCLVKIEGEIHEAHIPNSGRLTELLTEGKRALVSFASLPTRKTSYTLQSVWHCKRWVCVNSMVPNALACHMAVNKALPMFRAYKDVKREHTIGKHRFDLKLSSGTKPSMIVEVKSVTLVEGCVALFPDAPTTRGRSHLDMLAQLAGKGYRCAVLFMILRSDAKRFEPNRGADPEFAEALVNAKSKGVLVKAVGCRVGRRSVSPMGEIPIKLSISALSGGSP